jgi:hypothetical protein
MSEERAIKMLREFFAEGIDMTSAEATLWFRDNLSSIGYIRPSNIIEKSGGSPARLAPGRMYYYGYRPKGEATLPFYDRFPLTLVLQREAGGFLGLNFHYLHPNDRANFFNNISRFINDPEYDQNSDARIAVTYQALKTAKTTGSAKKGRALEFYKACTKRYYYSNIVTKVVDVPPVYWKFMLFLPIDRFSNILREEAWKKSRRMI